MGRVKKIVNQTDSQLDRALPESELAKGASLGVLPFLRILKEMPDVALRACLRKRVRNLFIRVRLEEEHRHPQGVALHPQMVAVPHQLAGGAAGAPMQHAQLLDAWQLLVDISPRMGELGAHLCFEVKGLRTFLAAALLDLAARVDAAAYMLCLVELLEQPPLHFL